MRRAGPPEPASADLPADVDARERILRIAYALFRGHGITPIGVDRIVAEAGVAKTTLYRHFGSKDELVVAVLERHAEVWTRGWLEVEVDRRARTPKARILAIFDAFDDWFRQDSFQGCLFTNTLLETHDRPGPVRAAAVDGLAEVRTVLRRLAEGAGAPQPDELAHELLILMLGSVVHALDGDVGAARRARSVAERLL
jgi:AcrR family transcriptional regulator